MKAGISDKPLECCGTMRAASRDGIGRRTGLARIYY
jgi:hypothetical protein